MNYKKNSPIIMVVFAILLIAETSTAQKKNFKFGKIPLADMEMVEYKPDPSAPAVVLFSTGHYRTQDYKFVTHQRIKILKSTGADYGNFSVRLPSKGAFKASTFNLEDGKIVEYKLKRSEVYEEEVIDDIIIYKLFLPNVKAGSIVELEYSHFGFPFEWRFQEMIPSRYNELLIEESQYFDFDLSFYGYENITSLGRYHWKASEVKAFKPEPFMDNFNNHITKIEFELSQVSIPGVYYKEYTTSWDKVGKVLMDRTYFGGLLKTGSSYLNSKAKELRGMEGEKIEKVKLAYEYIQSNMEWNGSNSIYATAYYRGNFNKNHTGNVAEINLNLTSLLRKCDIEAYPVVFSTRSNGKIKKFRPSLNKLNYVVCLARIDGQDILLDAAAKNVKPGVLPAKCLNGDGWLVDEERGRWVVLEPELNSKEKSVVQITLNDLVELKAKMRRTYNLYNYAEWKENYDNYDGEEKYAKSLQDTYSDFGIEDVQISVDEDNMKATETIEMDVSANMDDLGNEIAFNPFILTYDLDNPFKSDERFSPVDLNYPFSISRNILIPIPKNVQISKLPEQMQISTEHEEAYFAFTYTQTDDMLSISYQIEIKQPIIQTTDYPVFKTFYSLMIDKLNESITFKKT
ncbi:MAG: DUF3857 domain-containing protein [Cyclobacteriaceae bacterium]